MMDAAEVQKEKSLVGRKGWHWWLLGMTALVLLGGAFYWGRRPVMVHAGPPVLAGQLPAYAERSVSLKGGERTVGELLREWSKEAEVEIVTLWGNPATDDRLRVKVAEGGRVRLAEGLLILRNLMRGSEGAPELAIDMDRSRVVVGDPMLVYDLKRATVVVYPIGDLTDVDSVWNRPGGLSTPYRLAELLKAVEPEQWREYGGSLASVAVFNDRLVVTATPGMHWKIERLLEALRGR